jgi:RNA polymerase sigma-70 factor (ECF subfamily)
MDAGPQSPGGLLSQVSAASRGDARAIEELLTLFQPALAGHLARNAGALLLARESPDDLAQSVCREVLENLRGGRFRFQGEAAFREWLYRAATMKLVDRHRRWTAQQRDVGRERPLTPPGDQSGESFFQPVAEGGSPSEAAVQNEEFGRFEAAYAQLPERQREILRLHHVEGLPHGDIAARLGLSEANSRMLLSRALARIGRRLADG